MTRRRALPWAALGLGAAGAAALVAWLALAGGTEPVIGSAGSEPVAAVATVTPLSHFPGDRVTAVLDLTVNPSLTDPEAVDVQARFRPYTRVEPIGVERLEGDGAVLLRYTYALQCIDRACIARAPEEVAFAPAVVRYPNETVGQGILSVDWPAVSLTSRLAPGDAGDPVFRADPDTPPPLDYGISPTLLAWLLAGAAAAIVLAVATVAWLLLRRPVRTPATVDETPPAVSPLDAVLARLDAAAGQGEPERRLALDALARALDDAGRGDQAGAARRAAWSRVAPTRSEARELVAAARRGDGG